MSTPEFDAVMNKMDLHDRTFKLAKSWGTTDELAEVFAASQSAKFKWDGVALTYNGANAVDDAATKAHFTEGALKPLFPTAATNKDAPKIPPELLESAKGGNLTSRGALVRLLGSLEAAEAALADKPGDISVVDDKTKAPVKVPALKGATNPWTPDCTDAAGRPAWSAAARRRQTDAVKSLGPTVAASIAKSADPPAFLGSSRPGATNLTSSRRSA
jgi:hypothetical protein